jgi:flagellar FliL protein
MVEEGFSEDVGGEDIASIKKGGLPPIVIVIIIAVVMGVGGFFAGKILSGGDDKKPPVKQTDTQKTTRAQEDPQGTKTEEGSTTEEGEKTGGEGEKGSGKKKGLIVLDAFTVNLNDPFGRRYAEVVVNLVINDKEFVPKITENELVMPRLRDEIFMIISGKSYQELRSTSGKVTLKEEVQMRVNEIMREEFDREPVSGVLFTKFLIQ